MAQLCVVHPLSDTGFDLAVVHARFLAGTQWARAQCRQPSRLLQGVDVRRYRCGPADGAGVGRGERTRSEEHTSELQSLMRISYAVFCLKKTNIILRD